MSERTTSRVIPRLDPNDSVPLLTEVVELPDTVFEAPAPAPAPAQATVIDTADMPESGVVTAVGDFGSAGEDAPAAASDVVDTAPFMPGADDLRAVRTELLTRVMMRFRTEWPQVVEAHTEATLQSRLAPLTAQLANELTQALEARLVEWLDATLEEIERDPGGM
ncbi:hypothetical protein ACUXAV_004298 [Cupriavidus metallidurans]|jgi:hypothetical protein|uniref:DUF2486 family protein n=1 Tax=Cupriavidus metallidurans TaxID=119219 RepID=A0A482ISI2_9BURK|nr:MULTISPECIES: hypothetical protein [Cupriavidus]KWR83277.1 hypothetical protein RN01_10440 [Cupriavidus sp. SHE]MDE4919235.1 hypothetical protein [Cupriavidus metallidurans]QBP10906.1 hypothetical protein DDF84_014645 [Cupriavidus metallidurans]QWC87969.1 hypothetical protein KB891_13105 [Cupriavidus metallidurans]